jgi:hypothetical protein
MTIPGTADVTIVSAPDTEGETRSYVDWPAIIAGVVLASAISIVLLTFGSAIGLGFADFRARSGVSPIWVAVAATSWLLWVQISSFMAGGYLTGRLRRRIGDATPHEVDVRDGAHGLLVWAGALVVGAVIAVSGIGAAANAVGSAAATVTQAAATVAGDAAGAIDPNAYVVDTLFRTPPAAAGTPVPAANTEAARAEAGRILASGIVSGDGSADDRAYLAQLVAQNTGLSEADATARVDQVMAKVDEAKAKAVATAETARRTGVIAAFLVAASLLVSAIGAYWAASVGGRHRDEGTVFENVFRRY